MIQFRAIVSAPYPTLSRLREKILDECFLQGVNRSVSSIEGFWNCKLYLSLCLEDSQVIKRLIQDSGAKEVSIFEKEY